MTVPKLALSFLFLFFVFLVTAEGSPLKVCLVSGSEEYDSDTSLTAFEQYLEGRYNTDCTLIKARGFEDLPGTEALDSCEVALFFTRRLRIEGEQLQNVKDYCLAGRPIVAVRTASHGFQNWLEFDKLVLGGNYTGHFGNGPTQKAVIEPGAKDHPVLDGVTMMKSRYSLYKTAPIASNATLLMKGAIPNQPPQPVTWTRTYKGGRVFYTSLGGPQDFENSTFLKMLANALFWAAERDVDAKELPSPPKRPKPEGTLNLRLRTRVEPFKGSGEWREVFFEEVIPVSETAILICDMWDKHWCSGATQRCGILAEKMAKVIAAAHDKGIQVIHAPSETLYFYADWPQRRRMLLAPRVPTPDALDLPERPLPIDDSDGGCDTGEKPWYPAWTRQHKAIPIGEYDGISEDGREIYSFFQQEGIKNLIVMGVHTNMCVLGRSFGIRQMTRWGIPCILVRDLTDTMYNPEKPPYVSHEKGTELVIEHIEKYWCPSISSEDLLQGLP